MRHGSGANPGSVEIIATINDYNINMLPPPLTYSANMRALPGTAHNIEIKTKRLDSNNYNCFYCTSKNTAIHYTLDPVRSLSKQPNTVQQYNKEKTGLGPARQSAPLQALTRLSITFRFIIIVSPGLFLLPSAFFK